ncbi:hypothetical protein [Nocardia sp. NPDC050406]|uniref:hypothetical protein n=1 Tax=Nocardia sp. NPDC050406 TaxID=3364318 RepID=UPI00379A5EEB
MKHTADQAVSAGSSKRAVRRGIAAAAAVAAVAGMIGAVSGTAVAEPGAGCLWAGTHYATGTTVVAGGWNFTCEPGPRWSRGAGGQRTSTVANPGAARNPTGVFSVGAMQPGTEYTDYCVGEQLIDGGEALYEVVSDGAGRVRWQAVGPVSQWTFEPGSGPFTTTRSSSLCAQDAQWWPNR